MPDSLHTLNFSSNLIASLEDGRTVLGAGLKVLRMKDNPLDVIRNLPEGLQHLECTTTRGNAFPIPIVIFEVPEGLLRLSIDHLYKRDAENLPGGLLQLNARYKENGLGKFIQEVNSGRRAYLVLHSREKRVERATAFLCAMLPM